MAQPLKPYPEYKDSGTPWLEDIPAHWDALPNRALFAEVNDRNHPEEQLLSVTIAKGVIRQSDLLVDTSKKDSSNEDKANYKLVERRDIAYNKMRAWQGAVGVSDYRGIVSPAYIVVRPRGEQNPDYFHYLLRTPAFAKEAERWSYGITSDQWSLRAEDFKQIYCSLPPEDEQTAIVRFLAHADRRIIRYIRAKRRLIELLNEQKQAIIHRAVTRGVDPNVRLKPSGVDWLGTVPENWEVWRLKNVLREPLANGLFKKKDAYGSGVPLVNVKDLYEANFCVRDDNLERVDATEAEVANFLVRAGDIFFVRSSLKLEGTGRAALVSQCDDQTVFECHVVRARLDASRVVPRFLAIQLNSHIPKNYLISRANTVTMSTIAQGVIAGLPIWSPPLHEQESILEHIDQELEPLDNTAARALRDIELLREYGTRLIADVVTGKLDVRAVELPALDEDEMIGEWDEGADEEADEVADSEETALADV